MTRQISESDPVFTQTDTGSNLSTSETNPPVRIEPTQTPSYAPSLRPSTTHSPTVTPAPTGPLLPTMTPRPTPYYAPGEGPTSAPTVRYKNADPSSGCTEGELLHEVLMFDMWGDGWNGRNLTFTITDSPAVITKVVNKTEGNTTEVIYKTTIVNGSDAGGEYLLPGTRIFDSTLPAGLKEGYDYACIRPGVCYQATISGGLWSEEIMWEVRRTEYDVNPVDNNGIMIAKGGAPSTCVFSIPDETSGFTFCKTTCSFIPGDPTLYPTASPTDSLKPSAIPSAIPSAMPSTMPSAMPSAMPSSIPTQVPSEMPPSARIGAPTIIEPESPLMIPTEAPLVVPSSQAPSLPTLGSGGQPSPTGSGTVLRPLYGNTPPSQVVNVAPPGTQSPMPVATGTQSPTSVVILAPDTQSPSTAATETLLPTVATGTQSPTLVATETQIPMPVATETQTPVTGESASSDSLRRPLPLSPTISPPTEPSTLSAVQSPTMSAASPATGPTIPVAALGEPVETLVLPNYGGFRRNVGV